MTVTLRLLAESDAATLTRLAIENRAFMAPWDAVRGEEHFIEQYFRIAGRWQDHVLFQRLADEAA